MSLMPRDPVTLLSSLLWSTIACGSPSGQVGDASGNETLPSVDTSGSAPDAAGPEDLPAVLDSDAGGSDAEALEASDVAPSETGDVAPGGTDAADTEPADMSDDTEALVYGGPPALTVVFPSITVPGGAIYLTGEHLVRPDGDTGQTEVWLMTESGVRLDLRIASATLLGGATSRVAVITPPDLAATLGASGELFIATPLGEDAYRPILVTESFTFSGKTSPGAGLRGNVYRLRSNTGALPDLRGTPCTDPSVVSDAQTPCPYASIVAARLAIPQTRYTSGFPGIGQSLVEWFAIGFEGHLSVPEAGDWSFKLCSDDGSKLFTGGANGWALAVNNDGQHAMRCVETTLALEAGLLPIFVEYYQGPREEIALEFYWRGPGVDEQRLVPAEVLRLFAD
jgi:hypothetical protein